MPSLNPVLVSAKAAIPPLPLDEAPEVLALLVEAVLLVVPPPAPVVALVVPPAPPEPLVLPDDADVEAPPDDVPLVVVVSPLEHAATEPRPIVSAKSEVQAFMIRDAITTRRLRGAGPRATRTLVYTLAPMPRAAPLRARASPLDRAPAGAR